MGHLKSVVAGYASALIVGVVAVFVSGAWAAGLSGADEPAHFLNTYVVSRYLVDAAGGNPMAYATEFYLHYPKISIGHWPPAFYAALSPIFLIFPATPATAFAANLLIAALPAAGVAWLLKRLHGTGMAVLGAALWALTPVALEGQAFFMLDAPLAALAVAALILWILYVERQTWLRILVFALLVATAILVKGNGWLLVLLPAFHIALTGSWRLLASVKPWVAAALAAGLVLPWYWLTAGIAAEGFNYAPGPAYAAQALTFNLAVLARNVTPIGLGLALFALVVGWRARREEPARWLVQSGCASLILATLALQSIVPVDLDDRYMAPTLPPLVVLILAGAHQLVTVARWRGALAAVLAAVLLAPGIWHLATREAKLGFRMDEIAALAQPGAWLIDGSSGAEGAFIAEMAVRDPGLTGYTIRASRILAESNFMGSSYQLRYQTPEQVMTELRRLGIGGIVIVRAEGAERFPHSAQLEAALQRPDSGYRRVTALRLAGRPGEVVVYRPVGAVQPNIPAIRALGLPERSRNLAGTPSS